MRLLDRVKAWLDPEHEALRRRKRLMLHDGRWMTFEAYLDERQFAMVLEVAADGPCRRMEER